MSKRLIRILRLKSVVYSFSLFSCDNGNLFMSYQVCQKHRGKPLLFSISATWLFYVHCTTHGTYSFTSQLRYKKLSNNGCLLKDTSVRTRSCYSADQKHESLSPVHLTAWPGHATNNSVLFTPGVWAHKSKIPATKDVMVICIVNTLTIILYEAGFKFNQASTLWCFVCDSISTKHCKE